MLKSLDMFGFKSFADRTRFDFSRGITCVVGPNGSGKSNVVDSIKWVLGDQSPKSLRGKEMTDVIFNGASGRKPAAFAEVLLTFDNASRCLTLDAAEVQIGRRLWRNGDSEYLINQQPARLKDIRDLFLGTGAGSSAYSIIEQGRVDQILQSNAAARRHVFEEAAGVSRYKARKEEATRKLERVEQNLLRLRDIVDEVESQLNALRTQAGKAAKYREVSAELREWWFGLAADDHRHFSAQLTIVDANLQAGEAELADLSAQQQVLEQKLSVFDAEIAEVDTRLRHAERTAAGNRESVVRQEATLRHVTAREKELGSELDRLRRQRTIMRGRSSELSAELSRSADELADSDVQHVRLQAELAAVQRELAEVIAQLKADHSMLQRERQKQVELMQQASSAKQRVGSLQSQQTAAQSALVTTKQRLDQCDAQIITAQAEVLRRQAVVESVLTEVASLDGRVREIRDRHQQLVSDQEGCQAQLRAQREDRSAKQSQQAVLEDLERRQEGLGIGVKEILSRAQTSDYAPWNSVLGSVADLLEADLDEAAILEVALGARAQLIVVRELAPLIEYLNSGSSRLSGRVGFLEIPPQTPSASSSPPPLLPSPPPNGVIQRADQLASLKSALPGLAESLLGTTWVVDTLDTALRLADGEGRGCRFVTLQGELLEDDGSLFAGTVRSETALMTRRSELRRLKNDLLRLDRAIIDDERQLADVTQSLKSLERLIENATSEKQELADRLTHARSDVTVQRQEVERFHRDREAILSEAARWESLATELELQIERAVSEHAWFEDNLLSLRDSFVALEAAVATRESQRQALTQRQVEQQLQLAKHEERWQALRAAVTRLQDEQRQRNEQFDEAERRLNAATAQMRQLNLQLLNTNAELWELQLFDEQFAAEVASVLTDKDLLRTQKSSFAEDEARLRAARRELAESLHAQEIAARDARHQLQVCAERIEEEYQMTLDEVVASGASAFVKWQEESGQWAVGSGQKSEGGDPRSNTETQAVSDVLSDPRPLTPDPSFTEVRPELEEKVNRLRRKLKMMGSVNTDSLKDLDELDGRFQHLSAQLQDLEEAKATLEDIIRQFNAESQRMFLETVEAIRLQFQQLFRKMFGGGEGDIILEDPNDVLDCGIDIVARPPGKELRSISLLSGGEKTMTAIALLMAIFRSKPSPFCILDEVDAALDEGNIERYSGVVKEFRETTQFIMITHNKRSMQVGDILYGVTMEQSGVSKRMSVRFEDVSDDGHFRVLPAAGSNAA
ncbi:MAG: chromosome segregation protein SMC [Planctomycetaceae bacterium]